MSDSPDYTQKLFLIPHHTTHEKDGSDEVCVEGLSGELADEQKSAWSKVAGKPVTFPPSAHHESHEKDGGDEIDVTDLSGILNEEQKSSWKQVSGKPETLVESDVVIGDNHLIRGDGGGRGVQEAAPEVDDSGNLLMPDGGYISTDKVGARDGDGLDIHNDGGDGIHLADDGKILPTADCILPFPLLNIMADSGRFAGDSLDPLAYAISGSFVASSWFTPANYSSAWTSAGKFIFDNSTNGGSAGALTQDVQDLLTAMGRTGGDARYGVEFYVGQSTMGSGIAGLYSSHYSFSANPGKAFTGKDNYTTWAFWIRLKSGGNIILRRMDEMWKDEVAQTGDVTLTTSNGWTYIVTCRQILKGYDNRAPFIYANENDVIQIAIPVCFRGLVYPGKLVSPIGKAT